MSASARLLSMTAICAAVIGGVVPLTSAPAAHADPCSVPPTGATARGATPSAQPRLPVLHLPIGRRPKSLDQQSNPNTPTTEGADQDAAKARTAVAPAPEAGTASVVRWLTGPNSDSYERYTISGADLGILWDNGDPENRQVLIAFGDTFGDCSAADQGWRSNTLFRSESTDLTVLPLRYQDPYAGSPLRGPAVAGRGFSRQVIDSLRLAAQEVTVIPTAAIAVGRTQYVNFMSVAQWGASGQWSTNFSAVAVSSDNGETWSVPRSSIRPAWFNSVPGVPFVWGYQNFQMGAYLRRDGYVYAYGTGAGRGGAPFLSRVVETAVADLTQYEYWTPFGWLKNMPFLAMQVTVAPGSEMSVAWNDHLGKFIMMYTNFLGNVVLRTADQPQGPWSLPKTLVTSAQMPGGIYAPYIHPWSKGQDLYFTLSRWSDYSVALMKTTLSK
jgi:hypothetical protein